MNRFVLSIWCILKLAGRLTTESTQTPDLTRCASHFDIEGDRELSGDLDPRILSCSVGIWTGRLIYDIDMTSWRGTELVDESNFETKLMKNISQANFPILTSKETVN